MTTSYSSMGDEEVRQPQRGEVISRSMGVGQVESLLGGGIRIQEAPMSSAEVMLVV